MIHKNPKNYQKNFKNLLLIFLLLTISAGQISAQTISAQTEPENPYEFVKTEKSEVENNSKFSIEEDFRIEKIKISGGAEIITIFANVKTTEFEQEEVPLISVLRDTLGDEIIENDRLRHVWMLNYTKPSLTQKLTAAVPFLYTRTTNKGKVKNDLPPVLIDVQPMDKDFWDKAFFMVLKNLIIEDFAVPLRAATLQYRANRKNYKKAAIARALALLAIYEEIEGKKILSERELEDIQARLMLFGKTFGSFVNRENLHRVYDKNSENLTAIRGRNWELLRQYAERENLYFEPLEMPDGDATHALVWIAEEDLKANKNKEFNSRFLNIENPWKDKRLENWNGYREIRWFDAQNKRVAENTPNATAKTFIPLAVYGLDYPKIPALLIDFRDQNNPKKREMSKRVLNDLTKNILSISKIDNLPFFVGKSLYDFVTKRKGFDFNQPTRLNSYAQLKLLLSLDYSLEPDFRSEISERLEAVSLNPLENDFDVEIRLAKRQYENLINYAKRPDGLIKDLEKDRREEMTKVKHTSRQRMLYKIAKVVSFGIYKHREKYTPELRREMDLRRQLSFHERYLREVAQNSVKPEIDGDLQAIENSLAFIAQHGEKTKGKTIKAIAGIFTITENENLRLLCLSGLSKINNSRSKKELRAIYENKEFDKRWRDLSAKYLNISAGEKISSID